MHQNEVIEIVSGSMVYYLYTFHQLMNHWLWHQSCSLVHQLLPDAVALSLGKMSGCYRDSRGTGRVMRVQMEGQADVPPPLSSHSLGDLYQPAILNWNDTDKSNVFYLKKRLRN